jgi:DNA-binding MarR family transcriptional regulator
MLPFDQSQLFDVRLLAGLESAALAVARGDAAVRFAPEGVGGLAKLRVAVAPAEAGAEGMIALLRGEGERAEELARFRGALGQGMTRARGGIVPTIATLSAALDESAPIEDAKEIDALLRGADDPLSPLLRAVIAAGALRRAGASLEMATLAATWTLCVNGAIGDGWLTVTEPVALPPAGTLDEWLLAAISEYTRDGRELERAATLGAEIITRDEARIRESLGRAHFSALDVLGVLRREGAINVPDVAVALGISTPTAGAAVERLVELGIAREITGRARSRVFIYAALVEALAPTAR